MSDTSYPINVLIVDGDTGATEFARDQLAISCPFWNVLTASTAAEAQQHLETDATIDAVVVGSDIHDMGARPFLELVRSKYPQLARIGTSGIQNGTEALQSLPLAHTFIDSLRETGKVAVAVETSAALQRRIFDPALYKLLGEIDVLPSPPLAVVELAGALAKPEVSVAEVGRIVESDVAMTLKLLQLVNSAFFGLSNQITNAAQAVAYLGLPTVRNLLVSIELVRSFSTDRHELMRAVEDNQLHSLAVAEMSRGLVRSRKDTHDAFVAGVLHDVGFLALISCAPVKYLALREEVLHSGRTLEACELDVIGATHPAIGAYVLGLWGLPYSLIEAVARSHDADSLPGRSLTVTHAVFVAEQIVNLQGAATSWEGGQLPDSCYIEALGMTDAVFELLEDRSDFARYTGTGQG